MTQHESTTDVEASNERTANAIGSINELNLLNVFLDELVRNESLSHNTQSILYRIALPLLQLCQKETNVFESKQHPARQIIDLVVEISKLSGDDFAPGDKIYRTVVESIRSLSAKNVADKRVLETICGDLIHVKKLATLRAPITHKKNIAPASQLTDAKIIAAMTISKHSHRFVVTDSILYFALSDWLELVVITYLKYGQESKEFAEVDRLTFLLFFLNDRNARRKDAKLARFFFNKTRQRMIEIGPVFQGHKLGWTKSVRALGCMVSVHLPTRRSSKAAQARKAPAKAQIPVKARRTAKPKPE